jgi:iron complex transport system substrate-binding protein
VVRRFFLLSLFLCACHRAPPASSAPRRVVSLAPSTTEILFALGAGDLLVGVDQYSDFPPEAKRVPQVGNDLSPSIERILGLRPDVVLMSSSANTRELMDELGRLGVRVVGTRAEMLEEVFGDIATVGRALGRTAAADVLVGRLRARVAAVQARVAALPKPRTLVVVWPEPLSVAGGHSFVDDAITAAGGVNVAADAPVPYPQYSVERLLARAPEVVIVGAHDGGPTTTVIDGYRSLPAVKAHRVHRVDGALLFRPGPRLIDGIEALAKLLHP